MKKVMFADEKGKYFGDYGDGNGMVPITQVECYRFINSPGIKCYGTEDGYVIYAR
jgi:hypothetical protein